MGNSAGSSTSSVLVLSSVENDKNRVFPKENLVGFVPRQSDANSCGWIAMRYMEVVVGEDQVPEHLNCGLEDKTAWSNAEGNRLRIGIFVEAEDGLQRYFGPMGDSSEG